YPSIAGHAASGNADPYGNTSSVVALSASTEASWSATTNFASGSSACSRAISGAAASAAGKPGSSRTTAVIGPAYPERDAHTITNPRRNKEKTFIGSRPQRAGLLQLKIPRNPTRRLSLWVPPNSDL